MSDRLPYVSLLRVIAMILIVIYHSLCFYIDIWWFFPSKKEVLWCYFAIPIVIVGLSIFVFISGFLFGYLYFEKKKYRNSLSFWVGKFRRLIIPYIFWGGIMVLLMPIALQWINMFTGVAHLWFLMVLFELFVIVYIYILVDSLIDKGKKNSMQFFYDMITFCLSFIIIYVWKNYSTHHSFMCITNTLYYLPFFMGGFFFAKYGYYVINEIKYTLIFFIVGLSSLFVLSICGFLVGDTLYRIPSLIVDICLLLIVRRYCISNLIPQIVYNLDQNSMGIYIFNQFIVFIILLFQPVNLYLRFHSYIGPFFIFSISFLIPWLLSSLFSRCKYVSWMIG